MIIELINELFKRYLQFCPFKTGVIECMKKGIEIDDQITKLGHFYLLCFQNPIKGK